MRMLTTLQKAEELQVHERTLKQWRAEGKGPPFKKFGKSVRYFPEVRPDEEVSE